MATENRKHVRFFRKLTLVIIQGLNMANAIRKWPLMETTWFT